MTTRTNALKASSFAVKQPQQQKLTLAEKIKKNQNTKNEPKLNSWKLRKDVRAIGYFMPNELESKSK